MKKRSVLFVLLLALLLCLSACTGKEKEEEPTKPAFDLGGRTYYNTVDDYGHEDHAKVWFGKDGTFVLNDSYSDGYYEASGTWALKEDVCTLNVEKTGSGSFSKIIFEVKDIDTLILKTTLSGSKSDQTFSTSEVKGSTASKPSEPADSNDGPTETPPESLTHERIPCTGLTSLYKNYWAYEGVKNYDLGVKATPENTTDGITYSVEDENVVTVDANGCATTKSPGSTKIHIKCGDVERVVNFETRVKGATESATVWKADRDDVDVKFLPTLELDGAGNFVFTENCYAGMGQYKGTYKKDGEYIVCTVKDAKTMQGFAGDDVKEILFKIKGDDILKLKTDLCMSMSGNLFILQH